MAKLLLHLIRLRTKLFKKKYISVLLVTLFNYASLTLKTHRPLETKR